MKKIGFGLLWFLALSMGVLLLGGMIAGGVAGANDPANAEALGHAAGEEFAQTYTGIIFLSSLLISVAGAIMGWLPGTKSSKLKGQN